MLSSAGSPCPHHPGCVSLTMSPPEAKEMDCMWWLAMICMGNTAQGGISKGAAGSQAGRQQECVPRSANLARGGDHEVQPIHGDVDSDAHAGEVQVALAQDGEQGFVGSLTGERVVEAMKTTRTRPTN